MLNRSRIWALLEPDPDNINGMTKWVDTFLVTLILFNVLAIILESVDTYAARYATFFLTFEVFSVLVFTVEYGLRIWSSAEHAPNTNENKMRLKFALTPMALVDLIAILPFFLQVFLPGLDLRFVRVLRMVRVFKLTRYSHAVTQLLQTFVQEKRTLGAALLVLLMVSIIASCGIYLVERNAQPEVFGSIPAAMWWAIATLTTVGYGDVTPVTDLGKIFGGVIAIIGIVMVAMPAGILAFGFNDLRSQRERRYEAELLNALVDGHLSPLERTRLDDLKKRLAITEDTDRIMRLEAVANTPPTEVNCPHCGGVVRVSREVL